MATQFRIQVVIDPRGASAGAKKVRKELQQLEGSATKLKRTLGQAFGILAAGALIAGATRKLADFGQEMSTVRAITQATADDFDRLTATALRLGTETRFSATQAAEGMSFLARAGFSANEVLETIEGTLNLAQAGALDLGTAADIASNALTAFRLNVDQTGRVVDVLALAANSANTNVLQLGDGLKLVAPIAAGVGVEIEEVTAAISALSNAGLQATLAGTGLRRIISELESPSAKTKKQLKELGLETADFQISSVGLTAALKALAEAGVDTGLGLELFGDRGGPAFEVLSNAIPDIERFTVSLQNADGTAKRIADTMDDNLNGAILATKSALEGFVLSVGEAGATGALRGFFDITTTGLRALSSNIELVTVATVGLGTAFAAVKIAPIAAGALKAAQAFVKLRVAVAAGRAVILGSVAATKLQAIAELDAAKAVAFKARADLVALRITAQKALVVKGAAETTFIAAAAEKQLAASTAAEALATETATKAQIKHAAALKATTIQARILSLINPFGIAVVAIAAAGAGLIILIDKFKEIEKLEGKVIEQGEKLGLTDFGKFGVDIERVRERLARLAELQTKDLAAGKPVFEGLTRAIEKQEAKLKRLQATQGLIAAGSAKNTEEANSQILALERLDVATTKVIASIEAENVLLGKSAREREVQISLLEQIAALEEKSGQKLDEGQKEELEVAIRRNQLLREQAEAFESVRGPQEAFNAQVAALKALEEAGRIETDELRIALGELATAAGDLDLSALTEAVGGEDILANAKALIEALKEQARVEGERARALAEIQGPLQGLLEKEAILTELTNDGTFSEEQRAAALERVADAIARLNPEFARLAALQAEIEGPTERLIQRQEDLEKLIVATGDASGLYAAELVKVNEALNPLNEEQQRQKDLLESIQGPQQTILEQTAALNALLQAGTINGTQYAKALEKIGIAAETTNTAQEGFNIGLRNAVAEMTDVQGAAQQLTENGFKAAEDALVSFVRTGEVDFSAFVDGLLDDIARLLVKQALLAAFNPSGGAFGIGAALFGSATAQAGGRFPGNTDVLVGEEGPEIIRTPAGGGNITPAGETAAIMAAGVPAAPPIVNVETPVNIRNVFEGEDEGERENEVLNIISRKRRTIRGTLGR